jgi:hypothetical protein
MGLTTWLYPADMDIVEVNDESWQNSTELDGAPDTVVAEADVYGTAVSDVVKLSGYGFELPEGTVATEIQVELTCFWNSPTNNQNHALRVALVGGGALVAKDTGFSDLPDVLSVFGLSFTSADGTMPTAAEVNTADFGVTIQARAGSADVSTVYMDSVGLRITYAAAGGGGVARLRVVWV